MSDNNEWCVTAGGREDEWCECDTTTVSGSMPQSTETGDTESVGLRVGSKIATPRQVEHEMEIVVKVLQPGPLGIIVHTFSAKEIAKANSTVKKAVENWKRNAIIERNRPLLKDYIY
ncbi:unnamed protein product [Lactuca saligna]|uniref:Uncharacterized protein n=1 Tax=Lactuca saligna TaxID=75948 RepID=A0AA36EKX4_LACSI|nr:unnamed protein product [Lactuca saligna]